jgi:serine/threonine-protein kinase
MPSDDRRRGDESSPADETHTSGGPPGRSHAATWGNLHLIAELGSGGFGRVYRAHDPVLARDVALKVIKLQSPEEAEAVLHEGQMLARVRHEHVVTVHAAERIGDEVGLTMELIAGQHLTDVVRKGGPMGAEEAAVIGLSVCQALSAVHAAGLIHRDVKTRNVMRESGGRVVLMDFGAGREIGDIRRRAASDLSGTPLYLAPELFSGRPASVASDLYSLGVLLFYLVTGDYPVREKSMAELALAHAAGHRRALSDLRPDLPIGFVRVVERALSQHPADRYASAGAMMTALTQALPGVAARLAPEPGVDRRDSSAAPVAAAKPERGLTSRVVAGVAAAGAGILALGFAMAATFNLTLGRRGGFSHDTAWDWLKYGIQSLVPVVVYAALTLIAVFTVRAVWRIARPDGGPPRRGTGRSTSRFSPDAPVSAAQGLLVLQLAALLLIIWTFADVLNAVAKFADVADRQTLSVLNETNYTPILYRQVLTVILVLSVLAWHALLRRPGAWQLVDTPTKIGGASVLLIMLLMLELPYRVMFQSDLPIVVHGGQSCFELGRRAVSPEVLVYCPDWPAPRVRAVGADAVTPTGLEGNLFSAPPSGR